MSNFKFNHIYKYGLALTVLSIPLIILFAFDVTPIYYNNDDLFLKQVASGELTGTPETHLLHLGFLPGCLLSALYRILPLVPWYGIFLFGCMYLSIFIAYVAILKRTSGMMARITLTISSIAVISFFLLYHLTQIQYTTVTAAVCAASMVCFYLAKEDQHPATYLKNCSGSLLLFALSYEIRSEACLMFLPTFFVIGLCKVLQNRNLLKSILSYGATLLAILLAAILIENVAYARTDWKEFRQYNTYREQVVDYGGYPDYETYQEVYDELGINYESYVAASSRYQILLDEHINVTFMKRMEALSPHSDFDLMGMINAFIEKHIFSYQDRPLNLIVYATYFFAFVWILASRKWKDLLDLGAIFAGRMVIWIYLLYIGRCPARVTQGIYIAELFLLFALLYAKTKLHSVCNILFISCLLGITIKWGIPHITDHFHYIRSQLSFSVAYEEIRTYFDENNESLYLLDTNSFSYFNESIWAPTPASTSNFVLMGSWTANSPWTDQILNQYGFTSYEEAALTSDHVYFVFMDSPGTSYDYLTDYIASKVNGAFLEIADTFTTSNEISFHIMKATTK